MVFGATNERSDADDVRGVQPFLSGVNLELHFLALGERLEAVHRDRGEMDEDILTAVLFNETVTLGVVEPLHLPSGHASCLQRGEPIPALQCRQAEPDVAGPI